MKKTSNFMKTKHYLFIGVTSILLSPLFLNAQGFKKKDAKFTQIWASLPGRIKDTLGGSKDFPKDSLHHRKDSIGSYPKDSLHHRKDSVGSYPKDSLHHRRDSIGSYPKDSLHHGKDSIGSYPKDSLHHKRGGIGSYPKDSLNKWKDSTDLQAQKSLQVKDSVDFDSKDSLHHKRDSLGSYPKDSLHHRRDSLGSYPKDSLHHRGHKGNFHGKDSLHVKDSLDYSSRGYSHHGKDSLCFKVKKSSVVPNPVPNGAGRVSVSEVDTNEDLQLVILSAQGELISTSPVTLGEASFDSLKNGFYFYRIVDKSGKPVAHGRFYVL